MELEEIDREFSPARPSGHASTMFYLSAVFLGIMAVVIQWWNSSVISEEDSDYTLGLMLAIWLPFVLEAFVGLIRHWKLPGNGGRFALICVVPAFRISTSTFHAADHIWLPVLGWQQKNEALLKKLGDLSVIPMLFIALMILPVFATELILKERVGEIAWLSYLLHGSTAFIWFAFTMEFIVMVSVAEKKIDYCKKNWLNLVIILLPLIAFLRSFQLIRAFRLAQASKMLRMYRMRSLGIRVYQTLIALSAIERLLHRNPHKHLEKLLQQEADAERYLETIKEKIVAVRQRVNESE